MISLQNKHKNTSHSVQTIIITVGRSLERVVLLLSSILLSRYLTQEEFGSYRQVFLVTGLLTAVFTFGIPHSINYFVPQFSREKQKSFIFQTMIFQLIMGLLAAMVLWFGAAKISQRFDNPQLEYLLLLISIYPIFFLPSSCYSNVFITLKKPYIAGVLSPIFGVIRLLLIVATIVLGLSIKSIIFVNSLFAILQFSIYLYLLYMNLDNSKIKLSLENFIQQVKFAAPIGLSSMLGIIIVKFDQIMISSFFSTEEYAVYSIGTMQIPFINFLTVSSMAVITPYLVKRYKEGKIEDFLGKWNNSILKISYFVFPIVSYFFLFSYEFIRILYTEQYTNSAQIFRIYTLYMVVQITLYSHIFVALGKTKLIIKFTLITLVVNISSNFLFLKLFGFIGPTIATVSSGFLMAAMQLNKISQILNISIFRIWKWSKILLLFLIALCCGVLAFSASKFIEADLMSMIVGLIIFLLSYAFMTQYVFEKHLLLPININSIKAKIRK